jgi:hypothetical protein
MSETCFCPVCWHHGTERLGHCPECGHSLVLYEFDSYEEKLMRAISHPVREQRMMAIETLGKIHYAPAISEFERIIRSEEDVYVIREVIRGLHAIGTPECRRLLVSLRTHPSVIVRNEIETMSATSNDIRADNNVQEGESGS